MSVYTRNIPLCGCDGGCLHNIWRRAKFLFTSCAMFKIMIYDILVKPVVSGFAWGISLGVICTGYMISIPIWYKHLDDPDDFQFYPWQAIPGTHDPTFEQTILYAIIFFFIGLPIALHISNFGAKLCKISAYYFYTDYYNDNLDEYEARSPLKYHNAINSKQSQDILQV